MLSFTGLNMKPHLVAMPQLAVQLTTASPLYMAQYPEPGPGALSECLCNATAFEIAYARAHKNMRALVMNLFLFHKRAELGGRGGCYTSNRGSVSYLGLGWTCNRIVYPYSAFLLDKSAYGS